MKKWLAAALLCASALPPTTAYAAQARQSTFGTLPDGRPVAAVTLSNASGMSVRLIAYGASIQSVILPDRRGGKADIALGYSTIDEYLKTPQYFGATVGRFANRLALGKYRIGSTDYQAPVNNGVNSLHGGKVGFDKSLWSVGAVRSGAVASVTFHLISPDGDQGYPGTMTVDATYSLDEQNRLTIDYRATTDRATIVNISNHAYWNLSGEGSVNGAMGHLVAIPASTYLPTDPGAIPTGEFKQVAGGPFDFRSPRRVGDRVREATDQQLVFGRGYDHNWVIGRAVTANQHLMARVQDPASGRGFELWSNQPGLQFYSGNFLDGTSSGKSKRIYREGDAIVMEPQIFPDSPNQKGFPNALLRPGQTYHSVITYRFTTGR